MVVIIVVVGMKVYVAAAIAAALVVYEAEVRVGFFLLLATDTKEYRYPVIIWPRISPF
jgi:hypothetical protein